MAKDGQFIHLQGFAKLLFLHVLESPAFLEADEHEMVPMGEDQRFPRSGDLGGGGPQALVAFDLAAAQHHQVPFACAPEIQIENLSCGESVRFEEGGALCRQGLEEDPDIAFDLESMGQGAFCFVLPGLAQLAQGFEAEAEAGGHQLPAFRNGARSMPKICPMASMAWRWSEPSAVAWRRKDWMAGWNWMA